MVVVILISWQTVEHFSGVDNRPGEEDEAKADSGTRVHRKWAVICGWCNQIDGKSLERAR